MSLPNRIFPEVDGDGYLIGLVFEVLEDDVGSLTDEEEIQHSREISFFTHEVEECDLEVDR